jgi:hypothetical protein
LPGNWRWKYAHYDPEFETFSWGDYPNKRTYYARQLQPGDYYFFISSLRHISTDGKRESDIDPLWAYFITGFFLVARPPEELSYPISLADRSRFKNNAHVRRSESADLGPFLIFTGTQEKSRLLKRAIPISNKKVPNSLAKNAMPWLIEANNPDWQGRWWEGLLPEEGARVLFHAILRYPQNRRGVAEAA